MCLIITAFAAVITTLIWYFKAHDKSIKVGLLALMYWGASPDVVSGRFFLCGGGRALS